VNSTAPPEDLLSRFTRATSVHQNRLYRVARALCRDSDVAADLTQETLIHAFRAFDSFRPEQLVLPWLCRILRNVYLDSLKTGRARHEVAGRELPGEHDDPYHNVRGSTPDPLGMLERQTLRACLSEELEALEPDQRLILVLCDVEEMSYQEAAEIAGIPIGTVRSRLARCRERLRARLRARLQLSENSGLFVQGR
jgi:RNA polymerase sigma-70 factor (ECF subfamily)